MRSQTIYRFLFAAVFVMTGAFVWFFPASVSQAAGIEVTVDTDILDPVDAVVEKAVEPVLKEVIQARQAIEEMKRIGEEAAKIEEAVKNLSELEIRLEGARIKAAADTTGLPVDEVRAMRSRGIGWGVIAQQLGFHPGSLGLGHGKGVKPKIKGKPPKGKVKVKGKGKTKIKKKGKK